MNHQFRTAKLTATLGALSIAWACLLAAAGAQERIARETQLIEVLRSSASVQEKDKACRELQVIGSPASIPALAALLTDSELSHMARYALEPMPFLQAGEALRNALSRTTSLVQVGIINSLGFREDREAAPALIGLLKASDAEVAGAAAAALGRIATPEALQALERLRASAGGSLQAVAAEAALTAARRLVRDGRQPAAIRIYEQMQAARWPVHVRQGAFGGLLLAQPAEAPARIARAIEGKDPVLTPLAIAAIPSLKDPSSVARFSAMLPKLEPDTQVLLIDSLADCDSPSALLPALQSALASPSPDVVLAAVRALGKAGDATSVKALRQFLAGSGPEALKREAVRSLERVRGDGVTAEMLSCLKSASPDLKIRWIRILASRWATEALDDLLQEARAGDWRVRVAAIRAVRPWGTEDHLPAVLEILSGWSGNEGRTDVEITAARLARKIEDEEVRADGVLRALRTAKESPFKCSLLRVLGGIGNQAALETLRTALGSDVSEVREAALSTLMEWPDERAVEPLLGEWRASNDPALRTAIVRSCVTMLRRGEGSPAQTLMRYRELLGGAQSREDKVAVLSGLAEVAHPAALDLVEPALSDPGIRAEAEWCLIRVARKVMGSDLEAARKTASKLSAEARNEEVRKLAVGMSRQIDQCEDYVVTWHVAGPFSGSGSDPTSLLREILPPETPDPTVSWRSLPITSRNERPWMMDLAGLLGGSRLRTAYARTWVLSDSAQTASMELRVDEPVKVWLNSELVHLHDIPPSSTPVTSRISLSLREGWNLLMLKILHSRGAWEFSVKLYKPNGDRLDGLRYDADHGEQARILK